MTVQFFADTPDTDSVAQIVRDLQDHAATIVTLVCNPYTWTFRALYPGQDPAPDEYIVEQSWCSAVLGFLLDEEKEDEEIVILWDQQEDFIERMFLDYLIYASRLASVDQR